LSGGGCSVQRCLCICQRVVGIGQVDRHAQAIERARPEIQRG
jgi:hypothetical protein